MNVKLEANVKLDKKQLINAISNALFFEFTKGNHKKVSEMTLYELATHLPEIIADEIIKDFEFILVTEQGGELL